MIKRLAAGLGLSTCTVLVTSVGQVVALPVYLTYWGPQIYGEWITLTSLMMSLSLLNLGVQTYVGNVLIGCYVQDRIEEGTRTLHAALRLYMVLCVIALVVVLAAVFWSDVIRWLQIVSTSPAEARVVLLIQGLLATYTIVGGLLTSLFRVTHQLPRLLCYGLVERILFLAVPAVVAALGGHPVHASIATGLLISVVVCIELFDVYRRSPYPIGVSRSSWRESLTLIGPSFIFFTVSIAATTLTTGMTVVISAVRGATAVAIFATTLMLTNLVRVMINQGLFVLWPEITAAAAANDDPERIKRWHRLSLKLMGGIVLICVVALGLLGPEVLSVWTRGTIEVDLGLNLLLALYLGVQAPAMVSGVFGLASNRQLDMLKVQLATSVISIVLGIWLTYGLGVRGTAIALIAGQVVGSIWVVQMACRWTSDAWIQLLNDGIVRSLPTLATVTLGALLVWYGMTGLVVRSSGVAVLAVITLILLWRTWFTKTERYLLAMKWAEVLKLDSGRTDTQSVSA